MSVEDEVDARTVGTFAAAAKVERAAVSLVAERDAYRAQASAFAAALIEFGHEELVERVIAEGAPESKP